MRYKASDVARIRGTSVLLAACTSTWRRHGKQLYEYEAQRDHVNATSEVRWLIPRYRRRSAVSSTGMERCVRRGRSTVR